MPRYFFVLRGTVGKGDDAQGTILSNDVILPSDAAALANAERLIAQLQSENGYDDPAIVQNEIRDRVWSIPLLPGCATSPLGCVMRRSPFSISSPLRAITRQTGRDELSASCKAYNSEPPGVVRRSCRTYRHLPAVFVGSKYAGMSKCEVSKYG